MAEHAIPLYPSFGASRIGVRTNKRNELTFVIDQDDFSKVMAFTEHPDRLTGVLSIKSFRKNYKKMYGNNHPNATLRTGVMESITLAFLKSNRSERGAINIILRQIRCSVSTLMAYWLIRITSRWLNFLTALHPLMLLDREASF